MSFLELFPVYVAISLWHPKLYNKRILFHIDNITKSFLASPDLCTLRIFTFSSLRKRIETPIWRVRKCMYSYQSIWNYNFLYIFLNMASFVVDYE